MNRRPGLLPLSTLLLGLTLLLGITSVHANDRNLEPVDPTEVGFTIEGLEALQSSMRQQVDDGHLAGITTVLTRNGRLAHTDTYGYQNIEEDVALRDDTIFRIFSMTKPVAGTALMILHDEGLFSLDDPVSQYIPELANLQVAAEDGPDGMPVTEPATHEMTVRELMSHTGGLTYGLFSQSQVDTLYTQADLLNPQSTLQEMIDKLAEIPLRQQPGTQWHYSVSVDVQGHLVEVLSGQSFDEFLDERIFQPLDMQDTGFYVPEDKHHRFSALYMSDGQGNLVQPGSALGGSFTEPVSFFGGGGGLTSTAQDYLQFAQMIANGGELNGVRIVSEEAVELMRKNQLPGDMNEIPGYPGNSFGLNFAIVEDPARNDGKSEGSHWWWGIGGTWFWIDPVEDLLFIGMIQNQNLGFARQLQSLSKQLVYDALEASE